MAKRMGLARPTGEGGVLLRLDSEEGESRKIPNKRSGGALTLSCLLGLLHFLFIVC